MGAGAGLVALGGLTGCTTQVIEMETESKPKSTVMAQAAQPNRGLMRATLEQWKRVIRVQNGIDKVSERQLAEWEDQAKRMTLELLDHLDEVGLTSEMDDALKELPEEIQIPREVAAAFMEQLKDVLRPEQFKILRRELLEPIKKSQAVEPVLKDGGISAHMRKLLRSLLLRRAASEAASDPDLLSGFHIPLPEGDSECSRTAVEICAFAFIVAAEFCAFFEDCPTAAGVASAVCLVSLTVGECI
jgi:hypothetical protein